MNAFKLLPLLGVFTIVMGCSASKKAQTEQDTALQLKYSKILEVPPGYISNKKLYRFIDDWINTTYSWGGNDKNGIDCSAFVKRLLKDVYNIETPRTSKDQYLVESIDRFSSTGKLSEGDLVFFATKDKRNVSHVGLYLQNNRFINADTRSGVCIRSLKATYWKAKLVAFGRVKAI